ncbi:tetratricopeptide repeat protein [Tautonia plasticadhaerens]|uniref:Anaphase-promoting complex, cyclosome, subunit 3 n=1 Tax=Tautonia plasticadhaerens TaxID=2527974 RepID=A0A518GUR2_9BACT|nr:tetratricopeptide repeat protein [Tautonia plasticadhaerens]QDV32330.1 Anaphase-promoting complex, cyclosome, subunit 3 [Tautonia plasticadhaerens]
MRRAQVTRLVTAALALTLASGEAFAHGFRGGGGFRGGMAGGGMRGGYGGMRPGGYGGMRGGYGGMGPGVGGFRGGGMPGGIGGASIGRVPSFSSPGTFNRAGGGAFRGYNSYAGGMAAGGGSVGRGPLGGGYGSGFETGSYTGPRGGSIDYGAAGRGAVGPGGAAAGRGIGGIQATTPGGRTFTDVGRAAGAVGPRGNAIGGREDLGVASGPRGTAVAGSREVAARGPGGFAAAGERGGIAVGPRGVAAGGYRAFGASAARPYGFNPYGAYHAGWVHGYWNGHEDAAWGWRGAAWGLGAGIGLGWGLADWGYGSMLYSMGYWPYVNPYVVETVAEVPYDYAQPIDTSTPPTEGDATSQAVATFDAARAAFAQGGYDDALKQADAALAQTPDDTALHQFRALCLFALGRYDEAAAVLYAVLSVGPGWDWSTLIGLYPDASTYTSQLRALEAACKANPQSAADLFVLAYHYLTQGHTDSAVGVLKAVVALKPDDSLSAKLLAQLSPQRTGPDSSPAPATESPSPAPADQNPPQGATIAGTWTADPDPGTAISLAIQPDGTFTWDASKGGTSSRFAGKSTFGDGLLTLAQDDGPVLVGRVSWADADHMTFTIAGGPAGDAGLRFSR